MGALLGIAVESAGVRSALEDSGGAVETRFLPVPHPGDTALAERAASVLSVAQVRLGNSADHLGAVVVSCPSPAVADLVRAAAAANGWDGLVFTDPATAQAACPRQIPPGASAVALGAVELARAAHARSVLTFSKPDRAAGPGRHAAAKARRRPVLLVVGVAALVGVVAVLVGAATSSGEDAPAPQTNTVRTSPAQTSPEKPSPAPTSPETSPAPTAAPSAEEETPAPAGTSEQAAPEQAASDPSPTRAAPPPARPAQAPAPVQQAPQVQPTPAPTWTPARDQVIEVPGLPPITIPGEVVDQLPPIEWPVLPAP